MKTNDKSNIKDWGYILISNVIIPFVKFATPTFLIILTIYLVISAFMNGMFEGVRSLAGALLPLIIITFIFIFQRDLIGNLEKFSTLINFVASFLIGLGVMAIIKTYSQDSSIPLAEIVLSGSFSILIFSYDAIKSHKILSLYYGMISGFLLYIILWGFPLIEY